MYSSAFGTLPLYAPSGLIRSMSAMPLVLLMGWGMSLRMGMGRLMNLFPYLREKLGGSLATSLKSISTTFVHSLHSALYMDIVLTWDFSLNGLDLLWFGAATSRVYC